jgi:predicted extracellular nuclease
MTNSTPRVTGFFSQEISTDFDPNSSNIFAYQNFASYPTEMELLNVALVEE